MPCVEPLVREDLELPVCECLLRPGRGARARKTSLELAPLFDFEHLFAFFGVPLLSTNQAKHIYIYIDIYIYTHIFCRGPNSSQVKKAAESMGLPRGLTDGGSTSGVGGAIADRAFFFLLLVGRQSYVFLFFSPVPSRYRTRCTWVCSWKSTR